MTARPSASAETLAGDAWPRAFRETGEAGGNDFSRGDQLAEARRILESEAAELSRLAEGLAGDLGERFGEAVERLVACRRGGGSVVVTGMGKAGLIGRKLAATFSSTGMPAQFLHPAEAVHGDLGAIRAGDVVLALSNSGETGEVCQLLPILARLNVPLVAITRGPASTLGQAADVVVPLGHVAEACPLGLAPSTSTTAMLALGDALALVLSRQAKFAAEDFAVFHPAGSLGQKLRPVTEAMRRGADLRIAAETVTVRELVVAASEPARRTGAAMLVDAQGRLSGLFTDSDLARLLGQRSDEILDRPVAEVMTRRPRTAPDSATLGEVVARLTAFRISELPVVDTAGRPVGLIDITDVIALMPAEATRRTSEENGFPGEPDSVSPASQAA